jgi:hypothetical protein
MEEVYVPKDIISGVLLPDADPIFGNCPGHLKNSILAENRIFKWIRDVTQPYLKLDKVDLSSWVFQMQRHIS